MEKITKRLWNWASILDENTREQALRTSQMPFVRPHLALMPDAHLGAGATVGSVIPTEGAIMPAAVGVDIGCGMIAVKTQFSARDLQGRDLSVLRHSIERSVPLSAGVYNKTLSDTAQIRIAELEAMAGDRLAFYDKFKNNWRFQLGTLGSGNHFIEVTLDESDGVWLFLHSGSRGIGNKLAQHHIKIAKDLCERWYINLPDPDLAYLVEKTPEFDSYITDLNWAQHFALLNREEMMDRVVKDFAHFMGDGKPAIIDEVERINCHHNFTQKEFHMGRGVWLSRKGAIKADEGTPGLIP
ncbi:MAG: RtcB family protein, partial [Rhodococcus sp. (in: high G+C Gram-positive bacteria)]|nr:RtcB family protein [Rhodococcus sp. (in: high G+C Gram-positive bacteria)]